MENLLLKPNHRPLYQVQTQNSHPRLSLRRVLYVKLLKWVDKASMHAIRKFSLRVLGLLSLAFAHMAPQVALGFVTGVATWNGYRIPVFILCVLAVTYASTVIRFIRRPRRQGANQFMFHGVPVGELASFLKQHNSFKREDAVQKLGVSQGQYSKIACELEDHGILIRGENNARVLRDMPMEDLVRQLRDGFPLVWSEERQVWAERNGAFEQWCLAGDFKRRKLEETIERKERKSARLQKKIEHQSVIADLFASVS